MFGKTRSTSSSWAIMTLTSVAMSLPMLLIMKSMSDSLRMLADQLPDRNGNYNPS